MQDEIFAGSQIVPRLLLAVGSGAVLVALAIDTFAGPAATGSTPIVQNRAVSTATLSTPASTPAIPSAAPAHRTLQCPVETAPPCPTT